MSLTAHQEEKLEQGLEILSNGNILLIKGSAGVGKTFLADSLVQRMIPRVPKWKMILCGTPTHKALSVLRDKVTPHPLIEFSTVHSAMKLKRNINSKDGSFTFKPWFSEANPPLKGVSVFLIDEASMINEELLGFVEEYAKRFRVKLIFLGDDKQINPVKEYHSPVFHRNYPEIELTEIVRQGAGNPIIDLSRQPGLVVQGTDTLIDDKGFVFTYDKNRIVQSLAKVNGTDEIKYLAWTNAEVNEMNQAVREQIYGTPRKIEPGEVLVFDAPYGEEYYTNYELFVEEYNTFVFSRKVFVGRILGEDKYIQVNFKCYLINPDSEYPVRVVHEDSEEDFKKFERIIYSNACKRFLKWVDYFSFVEDFAQLKYNHAITVHKSQGSTYKRTIVNVKNINFNKNKVERKRLFYTAVTRASELLILYNA
jgi:exodeoxyribonuclease V